MGVSFFPKTYSQTKFLLPASRNYTLHFQRKLELTKSVIL